METPNGNPIASILPGLPTLQHRDSVIVLFRSGVDPNEVHSAVSHRLYPLAEGEEAINFAVGTSMHGGKLPPLDEVVDSLNRLKEHPGVIKPQYQDGSDNPVPPDGYMPFISLKIMPYQQSRMKVFEAYTSNIYIVTAGVDNLMFERWHSINTPPNTLLLSHHTARPVPSPIAAGRLDTGCAIFNERLGLGLGPNRTSLWMSIAHQFKTGMMLSLCTSIPLFNPVRDDQQRGVVFVSSEGAEEMVVGAIYQYALAITEGKTAPPVYTGDHDAHKKRCEYLEQLFGDRGWHVYIIYRNPTEGLTAGELDQFVTERARDGVKIELVAVDNLPLLAGPLGRAKKLLRELNVVRRQYRFHLAATNYLSSEAKVSMRGYSDMAKWLTDVAVNGCYDVPLAKEADDVYIHHVARDGEARVMIKPAGFDSGKPLFYLPLTDGGYTHSRR